MNAIENLMKELMEQKKLTSEDLQNMLNISEKIF